MANPPQFSSKLNGAPRVEVRQDSIRLVQRRHFGWIFVGFPVFLVSVFLISEYSKNSAFRHDPWAYLAQCFKNFEWPEWIAFGVATLLFCVFVISGLLYALWERELEIDLRRRQFRFRTGLAGRITTITGSTDELRTLQLTRLTATGTSTESPARTYEYWSLDLVLPGDVEPLNLGQWGRHEEAIAEAGRWQQWLPTLELQAGN
ncbi:hypothetical protein [Sulfurivermis fontis]|uniref:hypothetical protein n=1 Tax=Sulfurivermis fontis TaxID=1972068 RepID=UPI000FD8F135|nr:hypothetical protein [Sulfurivermis fontis]